METVSKTTLTFATIGSLTERGGRVTTATSGITLTGLEVAVVGDIVTYEDGSEAVIIDGAGALMIFGPKDHRKGFASAAFVGSRLSNGDRIAVSLTERGIETDEGQHITGLFDPAYVPPPPAPRYRLATKGATTARGGVLKTASSQWQIDLKVGHAATLEDLIHYPDGSTSRLVTGIALSDQPSMPTLAIVGSEAENGDTITDSPERFGAASSILFVLVGTRKRD